LVAAFDDAQLQVDIASSILFEEAQNFATTYTQTLGRIPFSEKKYQHFKFVQVNKWNNK
jgi:hypothetical protein